ncbi:MAG: F0F1 ATP synthase subunit delta, partial [Planctomycetes bacterium]|nr:F0F1 ATP synthase subunit delta [Planctomycetota bacterium]
DFLCLTIEKRRQALLPEILERFFALHDESVGRSRGEITTAVEMSAEEISRWAAVLGARIGRELVLAGRVDPEILGGLVLRFDGWVADASLKTDLERVGSRLSRLKFGSELVHED